MRKMTMKMWVAVCIVMSLATGPALATDGTWSITSGGGNYTTTNDWVGAVLADGIGSVLNISGGGTALYVNTNVTLGAILYNVDFGQKMNFASSKDPVVWPDPFFLTLDTGDPDVAAQVWHQRDYLSSGTPMQILDCPFVLNSDLFFRSSFTNKWEDNDGPAFSVHGNIEEGVVGRSLSVSNDHPNTQVTLLGDNSFSGAVRVEQGVLRVSDTYLSDGTLSQLGTGTNVFVTGDTATLDLNGFSFGPEKTLMLGGVGGFGLGALANSYQVPFHTSVWHGPVSLVATATLGRGVGGGSFWPSAYGGALEIAGDISDNGNGFGLIKNSPNTVFLHGNNTYSGGTLITEGYIVATNAANLGTGPVTFNGGVFGFGGAFDLSAVSILNSGGKPVILDTDEHDVTLAQSLSGFTSGLTKNGAGTLTLSGANSYSGETIVNRGVLALDYSTQANSKVATASSMTLAGGTLQISSGGLGFTQSVSRLTLRSGASVVTNQNTLGGPVMNFGPTLSRSTGGTVDFGTAGAPITLSPGVANGLYGGFATFGDSTWATKDATDYNFQFITGYTGYSATWNAGDNVDVTVANAGSIGADALINSLRFNNSDAAGQPVTLTMTGDNNLTSGGILVTPAMGANPVTIEGGTLTSGSSWRDIVVIQNNINAPLIITSAITNSSAGSVSLTKSGPGTLVISNSMSSFTGYIYVNGGVLEIYSGSDLGDTNVAKNIYLNDGATLRVYGSTTLGSTANKHRIYAGAGSAVIEVPNESDIVGLPDDTYVYGTLYKRGAGTLSFLGGKYVRGEKQMLIDPYATLVVEGGTLDIGSGEFTARYQTVLIARNGCTLKGDEFLNPRSWGRADYQDCAVMQIEGEGVIVDLNGRSVNMRTGTLQLGGVAEVLPNDYLQGDGRLVLTNSSATTARFTPGKGTHTRFTGIFEVSGDYLATGSDSVFALPYGELRLKSSAVANFTGVGSFCQFGALTGSGSFGGYGDQNRTPFLIGDDRESTFEFSGTLWGYFSGAGWGDRPTTGCRYIKTGSSSWRISGANNDLRQALTVRKGTVLTGADSPAVNQGEGALGTGPVLLGDEETLENESLALLTDGAYLIGNRIEINTTAPGVMITLGGNQSSGASAFTNALDLTRDVILTAANTDANGVTFSGAITGPGGITKTGVGTVYLTGAVGNAGATDVQAGELVVQSAVTQTNSLTVTAGSAGSGTFTVDGDLTLGTGATLAVSVAGALVNGETYTLVSWTGSRSGTFESVTGLPDEWHVGYLSNSVVLYYAPSGTLILLK